MKWFWNIMYLIGLVIAFDRGFALWFILITTAYTLIRHHKRMFKMMKIMGNAYADWCRKTGDKICNSMKNRK